MPIQKNISIDQRQFLRLRAKESLLRQTSFYLENFIIDGKFSLQELLSKNENFAREYSIFLQGIQLGSLYYHQNMVSTTLSVQLRGTRGLLNYLPIPWKSLKYQSLQEKEYIGEAYYTHFAEGEYFRRLAPVAYTGLIIDANEFKLHTALTPRIYSQYGHLIYGPEYISRKVGTRRGIVSYAKSMNDKEAISRAGKRPFLIVPLALKAKYQSDFVISNDDAKQLLESKRTIMNLIKCRVIILHRDA